MFTNNRCHPRRIGQDGRIMEKPLQFLESCKFLVKLFSHTGYTFGTWAHSAQRLIISQKTVPRLHLVCQQVS